MYQYRYFGLFRLCLASLVMFQHFAANAAPLGLTLAVQGYEVGSLAVLAFFCLSGFVIAEAVDVAYRNRPVDFMINRLLRVYPHFAVATVLSILLHKVFVAAGTLHVERYAPLPPDSIFSPVNVLLNLVAIIPCADLSIKYRFIHIAWAVKVEMLFYLVLAACLIPGWALPRSRRTRFGVMATCAAILMIPLFALAVGQKLPPMFAFAPYFGYGAGLYFALERNRTGFCITLASIPAMIWHFLSQSVGHVNPDFQRSVTAQLVLLVLLIFAMTVLAVCRFRRFQRFDRLLGGVTYPLYLYHYVVLIIATSISLDLTVATLLGGMAASVLFSVAMSRLIDPLVDRCRDRIRGRRLDE
jgi:peptidoglycan/LPS O-acetylase OafA/YrhL